MKFMYSCYLTLLHALAFLLSEVVGQPTSSTSPTINGPRLPTGHDDHSHNRAPVVPSTKLPTTPSPSKLPTVSPVAKPIPNPPRLPTKNKRHRGPTDTPIADTPSPSSKPSPLPTNVPTGGPTSPPTNSPTVTPPCPNACSNEGLFNFVIKGTKAGTFTASCLSTSAPLNIGRCSVPTSPANIFRMHFQPLCNVLVSISGEAFMPSIYVLADPFSNTQCPAINCPTLSPGFSQGGATLAFRSTVDDYDILVIPLSGTPSIYTLTVSCS